MDYYLHELASDWYKGGDFREVELENLISDLSDNFTWFRYIGNVTRSCAATAKQQETLLSALESLEQCLDASYRQCSSDYAVQTGCTAPAHHHTAPCGHIRMGNNNLDDVTYTYSADQDCWWTLEVPAEFMINLTFDEFYLEYSGPLCLFDYVTVYDGDTASSSSFGRFCGRLLPFTLYGTSNKLLVHAHTDSTVNRVGFRAGYQVMEPGAAQTISNMTTLTNSTGNIDLSMTQPVYYDSTFGDMYYYRILIRAEIGFQIRISLEFVADENRLLILHDGPLDSNSVLARLGYSRAKEGTSQLLSSESSSFVLSVVVHRSSLADNTTVQGTYSAVRKHDLIGAHTQQCMGNASIYLDPASARYLISLPSSADPDNSQPIQCVWIISTEPGYYIRLNIQYQPTGPDVDGCLHEGFVVYNGGTMIEADKIGPFCEADSPGLFTKSGMVGVANMTSSSNSVTVMVYSFMQYPNTVAPHRGIFKATAEVTPCIGIFDPCSLPSTILQEENHLPGHYRLIKTFNSQHNELDVQFYCNKSKCCTLQEFPTHANHRYNKCNVIMETEGLKSIATSKFALSAAIPNKDNTSFNYSCQIKNTKRLEPGITSTSLTCLGTRLYLHYKPDSPWNTAAFQIQVKPNKCGYYKPGLEYSNELYSPCAKVVLPHSDLSHSIQFIDLDFHPQEYFSFALNTADSDRCHGCFQSSRLELSDQHSMYIWPAMPSLPFTWYSWGSVHTEWRRTLTVKLTTDSKCQNISDSCDLQIHFKRHKSAGFDVTLEDMSCPEGFSLVDKYCYKIKPGNRDPNNYQSTSFSEARKSCMDESSDLVTINSQREIAAIKTFAYETLWREYLKDIAGTNIFFIGLVFDEQEVTQWVTGQPLTYMEWNVPDFHRKLPSRFKFMGGNSSAPIEKDAVSSQIVAEQLKYLQPQMNKDNNCTAMVMYNPFYSTKWLRIPCDTPITGGISFCEALPINHTLPWITEPGNRNKITEIDESRNVYSTYIEPVQNTSRLQMAQHICHKPFMILGSKCIAVYNTRSYVKKGEAKTGCSYGKARNEIEKQRENDAILKDLKLNSKPRVAKFNNKEIQLLKELLPSMMHAEYSSKIRINYHEKTDNGSAIEDCHVLFAQKKGNTLEWKLRLLKPCDKSEKGKSILLHENDNLNSYICETDPTEVNRTCQAHHFECDDGMCILVHNVCDGQFDCVDRSDERECTQVCRTKQNTALDPSVCFSNLCNPDEDCVCSEAYFQCMTGGCVPVSKVCDYHPDCDDNSDEMACNFGLCESYGEKFQCRNGECVNAIYRCDFIPQCLDASDEQGCEFDEGCPTYGDTAMYHQCPVGRCISTQLIADLQPDCEAMEYMNGNTSIHAQDDENKVLNFYKTVPSMRTNLQETKCLGFNLPCHPQSSRCFEQMKSCVYEIDHHSNLAGCRSAAHLLYCEAKQCGNMFKCPNSYCVPVQYVCDGHYDCENGEDETQCHNYYCPGLFKCKGEKKCVPLSHVCDGVRHCVLSGEDEQLCAYKHKGCPYGCKCLGQSMQCSEVITSTDMPVNKYIENLLTLQIEPSEVRALILRKNRLRSIPNALSKFHRLHRIDLSHNVITSFEEVLFQNLGGLVELHINDNMITSIAKSYFTSLTYLKVFKLDNNQISHMAEDCFIGLSSLTVLNISYQRLRALAPFQFSGLTGLSQLLLQGNSIDKIANSSFKHKSHESMVLDSLRYLDIRDNPLGQADEDPFSHLSNNMTLHTDNHKFCCFAGQVNKCYPETDEYSSCERLFADKSMQIATMTLGVLSLVGNVVILIQRMVKDKETTPSLLVQHLAFSDALMGIYLVIIASADQYYQGNYIISAEDWKSHIMCKLCGFISCLSCEMSAFLALLITVDRLYACTLLQTQSATAQLWQAKGISIRATRGLIAAGWAIMTLLSVVPILELPHFGDYSYMRTGVCTTYNVHLGYVSGWQFSFAVFIGMNGIIYTLSGIGYIFVLWQNMKDFDNWGKYLSEDICEEEKESLQLFRQNEIRIANRLFVVVISNVVTWSFLTVLSILTFSGYQLNKTLLAWIPVVLMPLNAALNPYLYSFATAPNRFLNDDLLANWVENTDDYLEGIENYISATGEGEMSRDDSSRNETSSNKKEM